MIMPMKWRQWTISEIGANTVVKQTLCLKGRWEQRDRSPPDLDINCKYKYFMEIRKITLSKDYEILSGFKISQRTRSKQITHQEGWDLLKTVLKAVSLHQRDRASGRTNLASHEAPKVVLATTGSSMNKWQGSSTKVCKSVIFTVAFTTNNKGCGSICMNEQARECGRICGWVFVLEWSRNWGHDRLHPKRILRV